jgi:putative phosphotransacetylase
MKKTLIPIGVSARHIHLKAADVETLFGEGAKLEEDKKIRQPGQFSSKQRVELLGPGGSFAEVAIIGPERKESQVEISATDAYQLGLTYDQDHDPSVRAIATKEPVTLKGPAGSIELPGALITLRHLHISPTEAESMALADGDLVSVQTTGVRRMIFENVIVRVDPDYKLELQLDFDEANAALLKTGDEAFLIKGQCMF